MSLNNKRLFLAGAMGMVGTSILKLISDKLPATRIRASYFDMEPFIKNDTIEYIRGDLRVYEDCRKMAEGCDYAIMSAAFTGGAMLTSSRTWKHIKDNVNMNMQMLDAFCTEGIKRIIYISSATLYQECEGYIGEEQLDMNKEPHSAYSGLGWGVRFIEKLCRFAHERYGIEVVIVRAANIFGPYDKFDPKSSNFIPALIRKATDKMDPFEVWGNPEVTRDVIYSDDFARAVVAMVNDNKVKFDIFNLGTGVKTTVGNVVEWALKYSGHKPSEIRYVEDKPVSTKLRAINCSKIKEVLGWTPQYTIEEGIRKTTEWWINNKDWWRK